MPLYDKPFKPVEAVSLFRYYLRNCRVLGCCFVVPLFPDRNSQRSVQPLRTSRWSRYTIYSLLCFFLMWQLVIRTAAHYVARGTLDSKAYAAAALLYLAQGSVCFVTMLLFPQASSVAVTDNGSVHGRASLNAHDVGSSGGASFTETSLVNLDALFTSMESRFPLPDACQRRLSHIYGSLVLLQVVEAAEQNGQRAVRYFAAATSSFGVLHAVFDIVGALVALFWSYIPDNGATVATWLASAYVAQMDGYMRKSATPHLHEASRKSAHDVLSQLKRDLRMVRGALTAIQDVFQAGLLLTYAFCVTRLCISLYYALTHQFHALSGYSYAIYSFYVIMHFTILSKGAETLVEQVKKLKRTLSSSEYCRMLESSEKREVAGAVLTYTVILIQTNISFSSKC